MLIFRYLAKYVSFYIIKTIFKRRIKKWYYKLLCQLLQQLLQLFNVCSQERKKLLGLLLPLFCFIGSIGIIVSQPAITNLISDGFTNGSHYYSVTVEKDNSQSQHIFQNKNDKKNLLILLTQNPQFLKKQKLKGLRNGICFQGNFFSLQIYQLSFF